MKLKKNRKFLVATAIVLALVIGASATFAWVTSQAYIANEFKNTGYGNSDGLVVNEPEDTFVFDIGAKTPKSVTVLNTGTTPMFARVSFEEMIKLLDTTAIITSTTSTAPTTGFPAGCTVIPQPYDFSKLATGWAEVTGVTFTPALPTGMRVYKSTGGGANQYQAFAGTAAPYQACMFSGKLNAAGTEIAVTEALFKWYVVKPAEYNSWIVSRKSPAAWVNDAWNSPVVPFVHKAFPTDLTTPAITNYTNSTVANQIGTTNKAEVTFNIVNITSAPTANSWYYNPSDGYFYYIGLLAGGASSPLLLDGVTLEGAANPDIWQKYEYTLNVIVEGLQGTKDALSDTAATGAAAGWQLPTGALRTALEALAP